HAFCKRPVFDELLDQLAGIFLGHAAALEAEADRLDHIIDVPSVLCQALEDEGRARIALVLQRPQQIDREQEGMLTPCPCQVHTAHYGASTRVRVGTPSNWI